MSKKLTVYGSMHCGGCVEAKQILEERRIPHEFIYITDSIQALRAFLAIRDREAMFDEIRASGRVGIPFFVLDSGLMTFDLEEAVAEL